MTLLTDLKHPLISDIESCKYLMTNEVRPVYGQLFEFSVGSGLVGSETYEVAGIKDIKPIGITEGSPLFSFTFNEFVAYSITEEMYRTDTTKGEVFEGGWVRMASKSYFLEFVLNSTWATNEFPGKLLHYQVNTLDHTIDVVTASPPKLELLSK